eukprot:SAG31_NODE_34484_length_332_cov_1.090129_1_plen_81_part_01
MTRRNVTRARMAGTAHVTAAQQCQQPSTRAIHTGELEQLIWQPPDDVRRERRLTIAELAGFQHGVAEEWLHRHGKSQPRKA